MQARREQRAYMSIFYDLSTQYRSAGITDNISAPETNILKIVEMLKDKPMYRISIHDEGIQTDCYDLLENFAPELKKYYESVDELPKWVQDRIAVLMLLDHTKLNEEVKDVGRRISKDIFWVFKGENDGDYPRG